MSSNIMSHSTDGENISPVPGERCPIWFGGMRTLANATVVHRGDSRRGRLDCFSLCKVCSTHSQSPRKVSVAFKKPSATAKGHSPQDRETSGTEDQRLAQVRQQDSGRVMLSLTHKPCQSPKATTEILL